ncbi:MAG: hypothetical protein AB1467_02260 [Candidatus Diapherotrites archaeon]
MSSVLLKELNFAIKLLFFLMAFFLVVYASVAFGNYLGEFRDYFFRAGNYWQAALILIFVLGIGYILRKLLVWETRGLVGKKRKRR